MLLAKWTLLSGADRPKDMRPEDKISDFEAYLLGKDASESYQTRAELYNYGRALRKRSRHYTLSIRSSGEIAINRCMGPSVYGLLTSHLYPAMAAEYEWTFNSVKKLIIS